MATKTFQSSNLDLLDKDVNEFCSNHKVFATQHNTCYDAYIEKVITTFVVFYNPT